MVLFGFLSVTSSAQNDVKEGSIGRYSVYIELEKAYVSGLCIMKYDGEYILASIFNEFGVSTLTYLYDIQRRTVKVLSLIKPLEYIKGTLKKDLKFIMNEICLDNNGSGKENYIYTNRDKKITYRFTPLTDEIAK